MQNVCRAAATGHCEANWSQQEFHIISRNRHRGKTSCPGETRLEKQCDKSRAPSVTVVFQVSPTALSTVTNKQTFRSLHQFAINPLIAVNQWPLHNAFCHLFRKWQKGKQCICVSETITIFTVKCTNKFWLESLFFPQPVSPRIVSVSNTLQPTGTKLKLHCYYCCCCCFGIF